MQSLGHNFPYPPTSHEEMKFPYGTGQKTAVAYDKFFVAALKKDYVTAMDFLPTADELHANEEAISKCKFGKTMSDLRNTFDSVWNEASAGQAYTNYKQAQQAQRKFGTTKCASGLRVWSDDKNQLGIVELGIVDWALVEVPEPQKNIIPDVSRFINTLCSHLNKSPRHADKSISPCRISSLLQTRYLPDVPLQKEHLSPNLAHRSKGKTLFSRLAEPVAPPLERSTPVK